jgi:hypothetical protein
VAVVWRVAADEHLFTLSLSGELTVEGLRLEQDEPNRPEGWRINLSLKVPINLSCRLVFLLIHRQVLL